MSDTRPGLNRERIVAAAVALIERDGPEAASMRRVAAELGVGTMSLYNHVPNKAALLDGVAELVLADMESADLAPVGPDGEVDWREQARALAHAFRGVARRYPRGVLVAITRRPRSAAGLRPVEVALAAVRRAGFDGAVAVRLVRTVVAFVLGSLLEEAGGGDADLPDGAARAEELARAGLPNVAALLPELVERDPDADFDFGLELLIGAMEAALEAATEVATEVAMEAQPPLG